MAGKLFNSPKYKIMKLKNYTLSILLFLSTITSTQAGTTLVDSLISNGVYRTFRVYVPTSYNASSPVPLVLNLHGYTSNAVQQEFYGNFIGIADTANFILVHPQGLTVSGLDTTGFGWTSFKPMSTPNTDLQFLEELMDHIIAQYNINTNRVYCAGMSNGGFMSYDLACFLSDRIAAIASVAGSMNFQHFPACNPNKPMPIMQIHGTADDVVDYNGSVSDVNIDTLVNFFVDFNNCNPSPTFTALPDINTSDRSTAEHYVYTGGDNGSSVELYKIIGGGHTWPGAPVNRGTTNRDFNASKEIWRFFSQYDLPASINESSAKTNHLIYPNPSTGTFTLKLDNYINSNLKIIDALGKTIIEQKITAAKTNINCEKFPKGIYFYQIQNTKGIIANGKLNLK